MSKKYELTDESIVVNGVTVYRIKALKDFKYALKGELGGYIESEKNLSQEGDCWIEDDACVYDNATICGNAWIFDEAIVRDNAIISENAKIFGNTIISGNTKIGGDAKVCDNKLFKINYLTMSNFADYTSPIVKESDNYE